MCASEGRIKFTEKRKQWDSWLKSRQRTDRQGPTEERRDICKQQGLRASQESPSLSDVIKTQSWGVRKGERVIRWRQTRIGTPSCEEKDAENPFLALSNFPYSLRFCNLTLFCPSYRFVCPSLFINLRAKPKFGLVAKLTLAFDTCVVCVNLVRCPHGAVFVKNNIVSMDFSVPLRQQLLSHLRV